jgi:TonB family protein
MIEVRPKGQRIDRRWTANEPGQHATLRAMKAAPLPSLAAAAIVAALAVVACGSNKPDPATPTPSAPADGDASAAAVPSEPAASTPTPGPASAEPADAGGGGASPKPIVVETKDECTPVGVDFEKRARPKLKDCYAQGKKKEPNLEGTVKIKITVDLKGKIKSVKVMEKTLPDAVAECMLKVVKATPFPEVDRCWDATLTIPITFPTPK